MIPSLPVNYFIMVYHWLFEPYLGISKQISERNETARAPVWAHFCMHLRIFICAFVCECVAYACVDFTAKMSMIFFTPSTIKNAILALFLFFVIFCFNWSRKCVKKRFNEIKDFSNQIHGPKRINVYNYFLKWNWLNVVKESYLIDFDGYSAQSSNSSRSSFDAILVRFFYYRCNHPTHTAHTWYLKYEI